LAVPLKLPRAHLEEVARQIGDHPVVDVPDRHRVGRRLAESVECWNLFNLGPLGPGERLASLAEKTPLTHHQIRSGRCAVQYALSVQAKHFKDDRVVQAVGSARLARKLDRCVHWIDSRRDTARDRVRLLFVPTRQVRALWLYSNYRDRLVIVSKPNIGPHLRYNEMHSARDFLKALRERKHIARVSAGSDPQDVRGGVPGIV
jgi:hypothetical protein